MLPRSQIYKINNCPTGEMVLERSPLLFVCLFLCFLKSRSRVYRIVIQYLTKSIEQTLLIQAGKVFQMNMLHVCSNGTCWDLQQLGKKWMGRLQRENPATSWEQAFLAVASEPLGVCFSTKAGSPHLWLVMKLKQILMFLKHNCPFVFYFYLCVFK